jgi:hypothetical protein
MTDGTHSNSQEDAWIAKYRAALENAPAEESSATRIRKALVNVCQFVISRFSAGRKSPGRPVRPKVGAKPGPALIPPPLVPTAAPKRQAHVPAKAKTQSGRTQSAKKGATPTTTLPSTAKREA